MFNRLRRLFGFVLVASVPVQLIAALAVSARVPLPIHTCTYRFTARIKDNGGVSPFKVGELITGTFTYDLKSKRTSPDNADYGNYESMRNALAFQFGDLRFSGAGMVKVTIGAFRHAEHFQIVAFDLELPKGWEMDHKGRSQTYGIILQNAPPKKVIARVGIPDSLALSDFINTRELCLDFCHGVSFPGGKVKGRATVITTVEGLEKIQ